MLRRLGDGQRFACPLLDVLGRKSVRGLGEEAARGLVPLRRG